MANPLTMNLSHSILKKVAHYGLFITRLNNGDWMVGKANYIYRLEITQDHYADPNVSISLSLGSAVAKAVNKLEQGGVK